MRDLTAIVEVAALPVFNARQDLTFGGTIRSEFIRHDHPGHVAQALQQLAEVQLYDDDVASGRNRIRNAGGYYRSIVRMISRGDINLQSELLALRRRKLV